MRLMRRVTQLLAACFVVLPCLGALAAESTQGLTVTVPNGYANLQADDLSVRTTAGPAVWSRSWNGQEWKFNPQWESLSQSWSNLTGSQTEDSSSKLTGGLAAMAGGGGGGGGCWVWVDEDWQPTYAAVDLSTGLRDAGPMIPLRSTPFNREMPAEGSDYAPGMRVSVDYASLCAGSGGGSSAVSMEGLRRINELHLGEAGRFAFNNRTTIEKRAVRQLSALSLSELTSGQVPLVPVTNEKGFRWLDRTGAWIDYNTRGQVVAYGDRNNNTIWLARDARGILQGVLDGSGRVLFTLHYSGELLTEVRDYPVAGLNGDLPPRTVKYAYDSRNRLTQVTDARGYVVRYDYDIANHIVKITDQEGRVESLTYTGDTVLARVAPDGGVTNYQFDYDDVNKQFVSKITGPETPAGRRLEDLTHNRVGKLVRRLVNGSTEAEIQYDTGARSESLTNARGFTTRITRNEFEQPVEVVNADGTVRRYEFSSANLSIASFTDEAGVRTVYDVDGKGNTVRATEAAGTADERVTEYELDATGRPKKVTRKGRVEATGFVTPDAVWQLSYDERGQVSQTIDPMGRIRTYVYDRAGNTVGYTNPAGQTTRFEVNAKGQLVKMTNALGDQLVLEYDKVGDPVASVNRLGKSARAVYDSMRRLVQFTTAVGAVSRVSYNAEGLPTEEVDEDGRKTALQFDTLLRVTREVDELGNVTSYDYQVADGTSSGLRGSLGMPTEIQYPTFTRRTRYDAMERPTSDTLLNPGRLGTEGLVSSTTYDARGLVSTETNAEGKTRKFAYNAFGQIVQATDSLGAVTQAVYDVRGNLIQFTDAKGNQTRYEYDLTDRMVRQVLPMGQVRQYTYDAVGDLASFTDALGNRSEFERDALQRIKKSKHFSAQNVLEKTTELSWDGESNLLGWSETDHGRAQTTSAVYTYDAANRRLSETVTYPAGHSLTYRYEYTPAGKKSALLWADGTRIEYGYSAHGELDAVTIPGEGVISVNEFKWVAPAQVTLPGGTRQEREFDGLLNLEALKVRSPSQQVTLDLKNTYGRVQELKERSRTDTAGGVSSATSGAFTYDSETQLTQAQVTGGSLGTAIETFTLDAVGNRVAHSQVSGAWTYDSNNRLTQRGTGSNATRYSYDDAGNLTQVEGAGGVIVRYRYDSQNQLSEVTDGRGRLVARYGYDPLGRRLWKEQFRNRNGDALAPAVRTSYLYSEEALIAEAVESITLGADGSVTANGPAQIRTQYGPTPDSDFGADVLFVKTQGSDGQDLFAYYHHDQLGAPIQATNKAGDVVWAADYNVFGEARITTPAGGSVSIVSNLRLPGQYYDDETGLHYNYYRYYDTSTGRYTQEDPIGLAGGVNRYVYVGGDPLNGIDPYGLFDITNPADWPTVPDEAVEGIASFGDGLLDIVTFGIWDGDWVRRKLDIGSVNVCSDTYAVGKALGQLTAMVLLGRATRNPCNSFTADTLVHVRPRSAEALAIYGQSELKPISKLVVGDEVLAFSEWKQRGDIAGTDNRLSYEKVVDVFTSYQKQQVVSIRTEDGRQLTATAGHSFMTNEGWRDAILLKRGGKLLLKGSSEDSSGGWVTITELSVAWSTVPVFNLEVANAHTFFTGEKGLLAHNGNCRLPKKAPKPKPKKELPRNPDDLLKDGYHDVSHPGAANAGHRTFENPTTGDKLRFDKGKPGKPGYEGQDHYHRYNPNSNGKQDMYLDGNGNPCARGCDASHLLPGN